MKLPPSRNRLDGEVIASLTLLSHGRQVVSPPAICLPKVIIMKKLFQAIRNFFKKHFGRKWTASEILKREG